MELPFDYLVKSGCSAWARWVGGGGGALNWLQLVLIVLEKWYQSMLDVYHIVVCGDRRVCMNSSSSPHSLLD